MKPESGCPQGLIDELNHCADDFRWRVVRTSLLPQLAIINFQKFLVEIKSGVRFTLAYLRPVHCIENTHQRSE